jgi:tRNA (guanine-N7-)-methyltransferase
MLLRLRKFNFKIAGAGIRNIRLVHGDAIEACERLLTTGSISAFYVFFPDPWPKRRHHRRRLISPASIDLLHDRLEPHGGLHLATDHRDYFNVIDRMLAAHAGFERVAPLVPAKDEQTDFEAIFNEQRQPIYRCSVRKKY